MGTNNRESLLLKAWVRYDGNGELVPGSIVYRKRKPSGKFKELIDPASNGCCTPVYTTTSSTTQAPAPSDYRLKRNITPTGGMIGEFKEYVWDWSSEAEALGLAHYPTKGVIAQEVMNKKPEAVSYDDTIGYYRVNYDML